MNEDMIEDVENLPEADEYPEEVKKASDEFTMLIKHFKKVVRSVKSRKSLARVLNAVAEFPLGDGMPKLDNQREQQLFMLFQQMVQDKSVILTYFLHKDMKKGDEVDVKQED